jgi:DNA-binding response OmpR family regulator
MKKRILIVEDNAALAKVLQHNLSYEGFDVKCVADGSVAVTVAGEYGPSLIILDLMLPDIEGFEVCRKLRQIGRPLTPIIILSARSDKRDKLQGLKLGADDYVTKPFDMEELIARIHAVLRRSQSSIEKIVLGDVRVDFKRLSVTKGTKEIHMSHREFDILRYLAEHSGRIVYREELLREVWGYQEMPTTRSVDHAISRLRKKIEAGPNDPQFIHTVHGDGYFLTPV